MSKHESVPGSHSFTVYQLWDSWIACGSQRDLEIKGEIKMSKHTPGNWEIQEGELGTLYVFSGSLQIVELADCNEDSQANALLIAAAPTLVEALIVSSEGCHGFCWCCGCTKEKDNDPTCYIMRTAVSKALGKQI